MPMEFQTMNPVRPQEHALQGLGQGLQSISQLVAAYYGNKAQGAAPDLSGVEPAKPVEPTELKPENKQDPSSVKPLDIPITRVPMPPPAAPLQTETAAGTTPASAAFGGANFYQPAQRIADLTRRDMFADARWPGFVGPFDSTNFGGTFNPYAR